MAKKPISGEGEVGYVPSEQRYLPFFRSKLGEVLYSFRCMVGKECDDFVTHGTTIPAQSIRTRPPHSALIP